MSWTTEGYGTPRTKGLSRSLTRVLLGLVAVLLGIGIGIGIGFGLYASSVEPGAAIVKAVFEIKPEVTPPPNCVRSESLISEVTRAEIHATNALLAHVDIYAPKTLSCSLPMILWIHGGGFVSSSADMVRDYAMSLAFNG